MSWVQIVGLLMALLVMGVGLAGSVVPGIPGPPLILAAAVVHRVYFGPASIGNFALGLLIGLTLLSFLLDYLATVFGARRLGATWRGIAGAAIGGLVGLLLGPVGVLIGPFVGAVLFELAGGRRWREAARAGLGAVLGMLAGALGKVACSLAMIGLFIVSIIVNT